MIRICSFVIQSVRPCQLLAGSSRFVGNIAAVKMVHLTEDTFGSYNGEPVKKFTWKTSSMELTAISFGAVIQSIKMPDKNGVIDDVALGFDDLEGYVKRNQKYFGSVVGRCANRIRKANFDIDGVNYKLADNNSGNSLHGGILAFHLVNWQSTVDGNKVIFSYFSKDGEEGYPGDLVTNVIYEVTDDNVFSMTYTAATTKKTLVNLTNHSYFNLAGHEKGAEALYDHVIVVNADKVTEADVEQVTTGKLIDVGGTPFDLRTAIRLGDAMNRGPKLFDNNYCISTYGNKDLNFVSRVSHPPSGRTLEVYSNQPGVQVYTSNVLPTPDEPAVIGKDGVGYRRHGAFCLETQNYPDAIHHENFPKVVLTPGEIYDHKVQYRFGVDKECQFSVVLK